MIETQWDDPTDTKEYREMPSIIRGVRREDGVIVLELEGEVDLSTAPQLKDALVDATEESRDVIVNLSRVGYMDSSGFGTLLGATKRLRPAGGSLHLVGTNATIARLLHITRLDTILSLHDSEASAQEAVKESAHDSAVVSV